MEHFKGSLAHYQLELVMPALASPKVEGVLRVERGAVQRQFFFRHGFLVGESSNVPTEHLAQVLVDLRVLDTPRAALAFEAAELARMPYGTFLVQQQFVNLPRLLEALEYKAREAFFDCYRWESGEVEFTPRVPPLERAVELTLALPPLHRDAVARRREWKAFQEIFPSLDTPLRVFREFAAEAFSEEEDALLKQAETGAPLVELLASEKSAPLFAARRLLHLYRRGALAPQDAGGSPQGGATNVAELLAMARRFMEAGKNAEAVEVAAQVLEHGPVPEAHALYREAEKRLTLALSEELFALDGRLVFQPLPRPTPPSLTADDLYLYSKLRGSSSIRNALRTAAMGELAASRSVQRLLAAGALRIGLPPGMLPHRGTNPYGLFPAVRS